MWSKNKPRMTAAERRHVERVKEMSCIICQAPGPSEAHEPVQGLWFTIVPLCYYCHRSGVGIHGDGSMWKPGKWNEWKAVNETLRELLSGE
jgi:hypothetical protein